MDNLEAEGRYSNMVRQLLDNHQSVVTHLAEGLHECKKSVSVSSCFMCSYDQC